MAAGTSNRLARRRLLGTALIGSAGAAFLAACGGGDKDDKGEGTSSGPAAGLSVATSTRAAETAQPKPGGVINLRQATNAPLDPHANATFAAQVLAGYVLTRLLKVKTGPDPAFANNFELEPDMAEGFESVGDGRTVTVKLRAARFHDIAPVSGRAVESEDVKFSLERFRTEPKNNNRTVFGTAESPLVEAVETPDARTVVFKLAKPYGPFTSLLANSSYLWVMPKELGGAGKWDPAKQVIGAGPFMLESTQPDIAYKVKKHPNYFLAGQPYVDGVNFPIIAEEAQDVAQFQAGRLEVAGLPAERMEEVKKSVPKATVIEYIPQTLRYLAMQQRANSPLRDERVRRAAQMSIDRDALIALIYLNRGAWTSAIPANFGAWRVDPKTAEMGQAGQYFKYNPAEAKKLLAAAGYASGFPVKYNYSNNIYGERFNQEAEAVAGMLKEGGFNVTLNPQDYLSVYITPGTGTIFGNYEGMVFGTAASYTDPHEYYLTQYYSKSSRNTAGVNDAQLDAMILKEEAVFDEKERQKLVKEIQVYLADKVYYGQTVVGPAYIGVQDWLKNYQRTNGFGAGGETYNKVWIDRGN